MTQPLPVAFNLVAEANDLNTSPFRMRAIVRECEAMLSKVDSKQAELIYCVLGIAQFTLGNFQKSYDAYLKASKLGVSGAALAGLGIALLELGRPSEALEYLFQAVDDADSGALGANVVTTLANIAEAFWLLGDAEGAQKAFQEAIAVADPADYQVQLTLANQAVELGAFGDAVHFLARFLTGLRGVGVSADELLKDGAIPESEREMLMRKRGLAKLLTTMTGFSSLFRRFHARPVQVSPSRSSDGVVAMFNDTREFRERASEAVLGDDIASRS
jgi:tetratricopeptide (TPR) repeat protein